MLRFGFVLLITALPLLGMEAMSTRRETTKQVFDSTAEALDACQSWRLREGQFSALIPAAAPVSTQARPGKATSAVARPIWTMHWCWGAATALCPACTTTKRCGRCTARSIAPFLTCCQMAQLANNAPGMS